jgi:DNA-directed RNA polymerase specialized sigma24 family protein
MAHEKSVPAARAALRPSWGLSRSAHDRAPLEGRTGYPFDVSVMAVGEALARLTPEHRAVVLRSYFQGSTTAQIAADLGIADGTVKSRLHYALRALRLALCEMGITR